MEKKKPAEKYLGEIFGFSFFHLHGHREIEYIKELTLILLKKTSKREICSHIDGSRDYNTKWSQRKTNITWY